MVTPDTFPYTDVRVEQFAVRFKNIELAQEFKQRFEESRQFVRAAQESKGKLRSRPLSAVASYTSQH